MSSLNLPKIIWLIRITQSTHQNQAQLALPRTQSGRVVSLPFRKAVPRITASQRNAFSTIMIVLIFLLFGSDKKKAFLLQVEGNGRGIFMFGLDILIIFFKMVQKLIQIMLIIALTSATKLTIGLDSYQKQCFYQILQSQQKYSIDVIPKVQGKYEVQISNMVDGKWNSLFYKQAKDSLETFNIHKLAPTDSTYSFCIRNIDDNRMKMSISIQSGLELMEFQMLPDKTDSENLERELNWLKNQKSKVFQCLERMQGLRATSEGLSNLMSTKMIGFAIIGLLSIIVVNIVFYRELKKTFKDRKLI